MVKMQNDIPILTIFVFSLLTILCASARSPNDDISIIRQRVLEKMIWPSPGYIPTLVQIALSNARTLNSSCYLVDSITNDKYKCHVTSLHCQWFSRAN